MILCSKIFQLDRQLGCPTLPPCLTRCSSTGTTSTLWTWLSTPAALGVLPREIPRKCGPRSSVILRPYAKIDITWTSHHFCNISSSLIVTPNSEQHDNYIFIKLFLKTVHFSSHTQKHQSIKASKSAKTTFWFNSLFCIKFHVHHFLLPQYIF